MSRAVTAFNHIAIVHPVLCPRISVRAMHTEFRPRVNIGLSVPDPAIAIHAPTGPPGVLHQPRLLIVVVTDKKDAVGASEVICVAGRQRIRASRGTIRAGHARGRAKIP